MHGKTIDNFPNMKKKKKKEKRKRKRSWYKNLSNENPMVYYQAYHAICNDIIEVKYYLIISYILSSPLLKKKKKIKAPLQVSRFFLHLRPTVMTQNVCSFTNYDQKEKIDSLEGFYYYYYYYFEELSKIK